MITSQYIMILALGCIALAWIVSWATGHRAPALQKIFAALSVQALAAIFLSFSSASLLLSLSFAAIILAAVASMIRSADEIPRKRDHN